MQCTTGENRWWECLVWDSGVHRADLDVKYWVRCTKLFTMNASFLVTQIFLHILVSYEGFRRQNSTESPRAKWTQPEVLVGNGKILFISSLLHWVLPSGTFHNTSRYGGRSMWPSKSANVKSLVSSVEEPNRTSSLSTTWAARQAGQLLASWSSSDPGDTI